MKRFNRYEIIGIVASIALLALALGFARLSPFTQDKEKATGEHASDMIKVDSSAKGGDVALRQAIVNGSTREGRITNLIVYDLSVGDGREARIGDTVTVHYIGLLKDGPEFDNSYKKGGPISFKVGAGEVIEGWDRGIIGMKEGGKRVLVVPSEMGYGDTAVDPLPANATLIFSIELLSIE